MYALGFLFMRNLFNYYSFKIYLFIYWSETKKNILKEEKIQEKEEIQEKEKKQEKDERSFPQKQKLNKRENTRL